MAFIILGIPFFFVVALLGSAGAPEALAVLLGFGAIILILCMCTSYSEKERQKERQAEIRAQRDRAERCKKHNIDPKFYEKAGLKVAKLVNQSDIDDLKYLKTMLDEGLIEQAEYDAKKAEVLKRM